MMHRLVIAVWLAGAGAVPVSATATSTVAFSGPRVLVLGVWPNDVRYLDEATFDVVARFPLRYGAAVMDSGGYTRTAHTADYRKLYLITDRMESVEIVDIARREVVDTVKFSVPGRRIRIFSAVPSPTGSRLFAMTRPVDLESDRFPPAGGPEIFVYDTSAKSVVTSFPVPDAVRYKLSPDVFASLDENTIFLIGEDVYAIDVVTRSVEGIFSLSRPSAPGYAAPGPEPLLCETAPLLYHAVYRTREPVLKRRVTGILRLDLGQRTRSSWEVGPGMNVEQVAIAPDGRRAYLGGVDLVAVDLDERKVLKRVERIERGRVNYSWIVSGDGRKLFVMGVGESIKVYDTGTLELVETVDLGGDVLFAPLAVPRSIVDAND